MDDIFFISPYKVLLGCLLEVAKIEACQMSTYNIHVCFVGEIHKLKTLIQLCTQVYLRSKNNIMLL